jgi:hypothetical protein
MIRITTQRNANYLPDSKCVTQKVWGVESLHGHHLNNTAPLIGWTFSVACSRE